MVRHGFAKPASPVRIRVPPPIFGSQHQRVASTKMRLAAAFIDLYDPIQHAHIHEPPSDSFRGLNWQFNSTILLRFSLPHMPERPSQFDDPKKRLYWSDLSSPGVPRDSIAPSHQRPQDTIIVSTRLKRSRKHMIARGGNRTCGRGVLPVHSGAPHVLKGVFSG